MSIENPPTPIQFTDNQIKLFLEAIANGHKVELAVFKAGLPQSSTSDLLAAIPPETLPEAKLLSKIPLATVKERMNQIMLDAQNPDNPMTPDLAIQILERKAPEEWSKTTTLQLKPPDPTLPAEERERLAEIFALPNHAVTPTVMDSDPILPIHSDGSTPDDRTTV